MPYHTEFDIIIIGGGLSGLSLACLLGVNKDLRIACIDRDSMENQLKEDTRTTAISYGSSQILGRAGLWQDLEKKGCPIEDIRVLDGNTSVLLQFLSEEVEDKSFGWILANTDIRKTLFKKIEKLDNVTHIAPAMCKGFDNDHDYAYALMESGQKIRAKLIVGADGRQSAVRKWLDIPARQWSYNQRAVVCVVAHENSHDNKAVEHFFPDGPFAILPMNDNKKGRHCSSLVFTEHGPQRKSLMRLSDEEFYSAVAEKFPEEYGEIEVISERKAYPLSLVHASRYIGHRMVLVADAAHGIHPIAGQGLNLGFRDIGELANLVLEAAEYGEDVGSDTLLETYQRRRRPDNMAMVAMTDGLVRLFSNNILPVKLARRIGLKVVGKLPPAKRFFMRRAMGE